MREKQLIVLVVAHRVAFDALFSPFRNRNAPVIGRCCVLVRTEITFHKSETPENNIFNRSSNIEMSALDYASTLCVNHS